LHAVRSAITAIAELLILGQQQMFIEQQYVDQKAHQ